VWKNEVQSAFNKAANSYDIYAKVQKTIAERLYFIINKYSKVPTSILEIGCGTGFLTEYILSSHPTALYKATDIASNMVNKCKEKFSNLPNLTYEICDGEEVIFYEKYDWIVSSMCFQWFKEIHKTLFKYQQYSNMLAFSIPIKDTFYQWEQLLKTHNVSSGMLEFVSEEELRDFFKKVYFDSLIIKIEEITETFDNVLSFMRSIKKIGANTAKEGHHHNNHLNTIINLRWDEPFTVTYKVAFCVIR
jgi:malonyl-CoA O-methyltransferase